MFFAFLKIINLEVGVCQKNMAACYDTFCMLFSKEGAAIHSGDIPGCSSLAMILSYNKQLALARGEC